MKKAGKTTRPFRYDLNQIPYEYTVEVTDRFKGLDLIECLQNYGWKFVTLYRSHLIKLLKLFHAGWSIAAAPSFHLSLLF